MPISLYILDPRGGYIGYLALVKSDFFSALHYMMARL